MSHDKDYEHVMDVTATDDLMSNCCGAAMYEFGENFICKECKEWCDAVSSDDDTDGVIDGRDREFNPRQLAIIQAHEIDDL